MQTSYSRNMAQAIAGTLYDLSYHRVDSYVAETDTIYPGMGVVAGTDPATQVKLPTASVTTIKGIALLQAKEQAAAGTVSYGAKATVPVLDKGRAWVPVTGAVTADAQAYLVYTGADTGKWAPSAGSNASAITGAKFKTSTTGAGLAVVELN